MNTTTKSPELIQRQITIALPQEVWEILDGTNKLALVGGGSDFEAYVASLIMHSVSRCLHIAEQVHTAVLTLSDHAGNV